MEINVVDDYAATAFEALPVASRQTQSRNGVDITDHSPSVTVSIFGALSEILSQTTESSNNFNLSTPITSTTTSTTTTTTVSPISLIKEHNLKVFTNELDSTTESPIAYSSYATNNVHIATENYPNNEAVALPVVMVRSVHRKDGAKFNLVSQLSLPMSQAFTPSPIPLSSVPMTTDRPFFQTVAFTKNPEDQTQIYPVFYTSTPEPDTPTTTQLYMEEVSYISGLNVKLNNSVMELNKLVGTTDIIEQEFVTLNSLSTTKDVIDVQTTNTPMFSTVEKSEEHSIENSTPLFTNNIPNTTTQSNIISLSRNSDFLRTLLGTASIISLPKNVSNIFSAQSNRQPFHTYPIPNSNEKYSLEGIYTTISPKVLKITTPDMNPQYFNKSGTSINTPFMQTPQKSVKDNFSNLKNPQMELTLLIASIKSQNTYQTTQTIIPTTPKKRSRDYVIYGILPNNTVAIKYPESETQTTQVDARIVYGILSNGTVVRKYPNGVVVADGKARNIHVTNIEAGQLKNPHSLLYQRNYIEKYLFVSPSTILPTSKPQTKPTSSSTKSPTTIEPFRNDMVLFNHNHLFILINSNRLLLGVMHVAKNINPKKIYLFLKYLTNSLYYNDN